MIDKKVIKIKFFMNYLESALIKLKDNINQKKRVFVSFDYTNDKHYKYLLDAWDKKQKYGFCF